MTDFNKTSGPRRIFHLSHLNVFYPKSHNCFAFFLNYHCFFTCALILKTITITITIKLVLKTSVYPIFTNKSIILLFEQSAILVINIIHKYLNKFWWNLKWRHWIPRLSKTIFLRLWAPLNCTLDLYNILICIYQLQWVMLIYQFIIWILTYCFIRLRAF